MWRTRHQREYQKKLVQVHFKKSVPNIYLSFHASAKIYRTRGSAASVHRRIFTCKILLCVSRRDIPVKARGKDKDSWTTKISVT